MRIVDLDSLTKTDHAAIAGNWINEVFVNVPTPDGKNKKTPNQAIYFFSTEQMPAYVNAAELGLIHGDISKENYWNGSSIPEMLMRMIAGMNEVRKRYGLKIHKTFDTAAPSRVIVLTLRDFSAIEKIGAIPLPFQIMKGIRNANN